MIRIPAVALLTAALIAPAARAKPKPETPYGFTAATELSYRCDQGERVLLPTVRLHLKTHSGRMYVDGDTVLYDDEPHLLVRDAVLSPDWKHALVAATRDSDGAHLHVPLVTHNAPLVEKRERLHGCGWFKPAIDGYWQGFPLNGTCADCAIRSFRMEQLPKGGCLQFPLGETVIAEHDRERAPAFMRVAPMRLRFEHEGEAYTAMAERHYYYGYANALRMDPFDRLSCEVDGEPVTLAPQSNTLN